MTTPMTLEVSGLGGPICTLEVMSNWTVGQVQATICGKMALLPSQLVLLEGTERLLPEVTVGSLAKDFRASLKLGAVVHQAPQGPVDFISCSKGLKQLRPGHLRKYNGEYKWDATAVSAEGFQVGHGRGVRFRPLSAQKSFILGLSGQNFAAPYFSVADYAVHCYKGGGFQVLERGADKYTSERSVADGSLIEIRVSDRVDYFLDGELEYSSALEGQTLLFCTVCFFSVLTEVAEIQWL